MYYVMTSSWVSGSADPLIGQTAVFSVKQILTAHRQKYTNLFNNARSELVTFCFKVRPTDHSNRDCLGLCQHAVKRSSDPLKLSESELQGPAQSPKQPISRQFHFISARTGLSGPRLQPPPRTFINLELWHRSDLFCITIFHRPLACSPLNVHFLVATVQENSQCIPVNETNRFSGNPEHTLRNFEQTHEAICGTSGVPLLLWHLVHSLAWQFYTADEEVSLSLTQRNEARFHPG